MIRRWNRRRRFGFEFTERGSLPLGRAVGHETPAQARRIRLAGRSQSLLNSPRQFVLALGRDEGVPARRCSLSTSRCLLSTRVLGRRHRNLTRCLAATTQGWHGDDAPDLVWQDDSTRQVLVLYLGGSGGATLQSYDFLDPAGHPGWSLAHDPAFP